MKVDIIEVHGKKRLGTWAGYEARTIMSALPGGLWSKENMCWHYPLMFPSALAVGEAAKRLRTSVEPTAAAAAWVEQEGKSWAALKALSQRLGAAEETPVFKPHQIQCSEWLAADLPVTGGRLDGSDTGSGKSRSALRAAWMCWQRGERGILLISTLLSVKYGWSHEVLEVQDALPLGEGREWQVFVLQGSVAQRRKILEAAKKANEAAGGQGVVLISNHEQLRSHSRLASWGSIALKRCTKCGGAADDAVKEASCQAHPREFNAPDFEVVAVAFDEAHRFMHPESQLTRAGWAVADHAPRAWGLTGTPGSRSVVENTWALLRLVYGTEWPSKSKWVEYYAQAGYSALGQWEVGGLRPEREPEFRELYSGMTRRVLKSQVLNLPPLLRGGTLERWVEMGKEQREVYEAMRDQLWADTTEGRLSAQNVLVQVGRLTGLASASGVPTSDESGRMILQEPSNKVSAVVDMVANGDVEEGTVFQFVSRQLLYLVRDALVAKKLASEADFGIIAGDVSDAARRLALEKFQSGQIPWFMFTSGAGGAGITLTRANTMVAVQRPWSPIQYAQAQDRVHRIGSERHEAVSIIDLLTPNTVELKQLVRLAENAEALEEIVKDAHRLYELMF